MRALFLPTLLMMAAPAAAQMSAPVPPRSGGGWKVQSIAPAPARFQRSDLGWQMRETKRDIAQAHREGRLSRDEARGLRRELRVIRHLGQRYADGGLSHAEDVEMQSRIQALRGRVYAGGR